jgi:membrane-associated phospholipid phosphatase
MQKQSYISISIAVVLLLALTVCGSLWDLEIANTVYIGQDPSENIFGIIFSYIGIIPTFVGWSFLGVSIFYLSKKYIEDTRKRRWLKVFAVLLIILSFFYFCNTLYLSNENAFKVHFAVAYSIGIAVICAASYLGYRLSKKSDDSELLKKAMFLAVVSLLTLIIISASKELMCRPRFRFVLAMDDTDYFINWWQSGRDIKASLGINIVTDEFASLPSGHSAYSLFAIFIFPTLADYVCFLKKFKPYLLVLGFIWWAVTAFSRMTIGAHYLTDVTVAGLVTIVAYVIVAAIYNVYNIKRSGVLSLFSYHKT